MYMRDQLYCASKSLDSEKNQIAEETQRCLCAVSVGIVQGLEKGDEIGQAHIEGCVCKQLQVFANGPSIPGNVFTCILNS